MSTPSEYQRVADQFLAAYESGEPIAPPRETIPGLDLNGAYRIQQLQEQAFEKAGRRVVGRKIGLTTPAMQKQLGVDSPDFGFFTEDMVFENGAEIDTSGFISPKVEPELAFELGSDLPADATMKQVIDAVASTRVAVEIIDSRVRDWDIDLVDTVADNASCGAVILGAPITEVDLRALPETRLIMQVDGQPQDTGTGKDVMGHPLEPLRWLAGVLGEQGVPLKAGDVILTGSFCGAAPVEAGCRIIVDSTDMGLLTASFV